MGFSISWIAFKDVGKAEALRRTGFRDTGVPADISSDEAPFAFCAFPTGWSAIFSADYCYGSAQGLAHLSASATVLGVQIEEHIMFSAAALFTDGRQVWRVAHESDKGLFDLAVDGMPPLDLAAIRDRLFAAQKQEGRGQFRTDHVFDVPVELAQALTGYRHDVVDASWGEPRYEQLEVVRTP